MSKSKLMAYTLLLFLITSNMVAILNSMPNNNLNPFQEETKLNVTIITGNSTLVSETELDNFKGYLESLPWINLKFLSEVKSYDDISSSDLIVMLGVLTFENISDFLTQFVLEGGSLIIAPPADKFEAFNNFTKMFGVEAVEAVATDNSSYYEVNTTVELVDSWDTNTPLFNGVTKIVLPSGHPLRLLENQTFESVRYPILWGMNTTVADNYRGANLTLAIAIEAITTSKIVILGSYSLLTDDYINIGDNRIFTLNLVRWIGNKFNLLNIKNVFVSQTEVLKNENPIVTVNFTITNISDYPQNVDAKVYIVRAGDSAPLIVKNATYLGNGKYTVTLDLSDIRTSIVELWIIAHKKYIGYYTWPEIGDKPFEITIYENKPYSIIPDPLTLALFLLVPIIGFFVVLIRMLPRYIKGRKKVNEWEQTEQKS